MMKKRLLLLIIVLLSFININAQNDKPEINIGANLGIVTNSNSQIVLGLDGELFYVVDANFKVGVATGLIFTTKNNGVLLPLAASGRFKANNKFGLGLDVGYALPINNSSGSLYVRPMLEYDLANNSKLKFSYSGLNKRGYLNVGILFRLNPRKRSITVSF